MVDRGGRVGGECHLVDSGEQPQGERTKDSLPISLFVLFFTFGYTSTADWEMFVKLIFSVLNFVRLIFATKIN